MQEEISWEKPEILHVNKAFSRVMERLARPDQITAGTAGVRLFSQHGALILRMRPAILHHTVHHIPGILKSRSLLPAWI
jgi:hypothetical protein